MATGAHAERAVDEPPAFVRLAANPLRWRLLRELSSSDRAVRELTALLGEPQNLVSYHLRQLRDGGLVAARQSSADRRDSYYCLDLEGCRRLFDEAGTGLHPALTVDQSVATRPTARRARRRSRVLFLCTGNSARSQMAEALLIEQGAGAIDAASAGSHPRALHPNAVRVMQRRGIDISGNRTKHVDEVSAQRFDVVVTLCDRVREVCPELPSQPALVHWSMPDPSAAGATARASYPAFERAAAELDTRISFLIPRITRSTHEEVHR